MKQQLPGTRSVLDFYLAHQREDGLVGYVPWWSFIDWTGPFASGVPPQDDNGGSTSITLQMVNALREAADLEAALGDRARAAVYRQAAQKAVDAVVRLCWDESKGLVADTLAKDAVQPAGQHPRGPGRGRARGPPRAVLDKVLAEPMLSSQRAPRRRRGGARTGAWASPRPATTSASTWPVPSKPSAAATSTCPSSSPGARCSTSASRTWAETPDLASRSDCHAWSAHPNYDLLTIVAGIKPGLPRLQDRAHRAPPRHPRPAERGNAAPERRDRRGLPSAAAPKWAPSVALPAGLTGELVWRGGLPPYERRAGAHTPHALIVKRRARTGCSHALVNVKDMIR